MNDNPAVVVASIFVLFLLVLFLLLPVISKVILKNMEDNSAKPKTEKDEIDEN